MLKLQKATKKPKLLLKRVFKDLEKDLEPSKFEKKTLHKCRLHDMCSTLNLMNPTL